MHSALIIDADGKTPAILKNILAPYGFEFTITENGPEAVNVARQVAPDIIFLRAELPLTSGFSVCNRLRRHEDTKRIPLIMYSSNVSEDVFEQHRNLKTHADDYLRLPFEDGRLVGAIRPRLPISEPSKAVPVPADEPPSRPARSSERGLDVELADPPGRSGDAPQHFDQEFQDGFRALQDDDSAALPEPSEATLAAGGFKAQREVLHLKSQLNARSREILGLKDELGSRERTILDGKKHQRELQSQIGELESQILAAQEQILSAREAAESAGRDKQSAIKREEGAKSRLDATQKKLKDTEAEFQAFRTHATQERDQAITAAAEAQQRIELQVGLLTELEADRDRLATQLDELTAQNASLVDGFESARKSIVALETQLEEARQDTERALADAETERVAALESLGRQHESAMEEREQDHRTAVHQLQAQLAAMSEQSQQERDRVSQVLVETEENARLQIEQLTQTLAHTEEEARREIQQLQTTLAETDEATRGEVAGLRAAIDDARAQAEDAANEAARRVAGLEHQVDELGAQLDRAESLLARRRDADKRAQQALAVALKLLEDEGQS